MTTTRLLTMAGALTWALTFAAAEAAAQTQDPSSSATRPPTFTTEIIVTPERGEAPRALVPASTAVLERATIETLPVIDLAEAVSFLPGFVTARPQFHAGRPVVSSRGFFGGGEAEYIRLLVDGVPASDVESGLIDWSALTIASVRKVEAMRGPGASLYGDSAIGGVIQVLTDQSSNGGQLGIAGGSFESFAMDGSIARRVGRAGFNFAGAARHTNGGLDHSGGHQFLGTGGADGAARGFTWRWTASGDTREGDDPGFASRDAFQSNPTASDPLFRFDGIDRSTFSTAFAIRHSSTAWRPQARVYATRRAEDTIRTILLAPGLGDRRARELTSHAIGGSLEGEHAFAAAGSALLRFGVDLAREHLDTTYRSVDGTGTVGAVNSNAVGHRLRTGTFASVALDASPRVRLSGGVRWDGVDDSGFGASTSDQRAWSPRAGIVVHLTDPGSTTVFAQVSRAFKVPTLDQLFDPRPYPDFRGGTFTISNPSLVPQRATNVEAGVSGRVDRASIRWNALAYHMMVDDEIDFDVRTFSYANIGESRHTGFEAEVEGQWWKRVRPSLAYALTRVVDADGGELQLKNVPEHVVSAAAAIDGPWAIGAMLRFYYTGGAFLDDQNAYAIDGPATLDFRVRRPVGGHTLFVDVLNATNNLYEEYGLTLTDFRGRVVPYVYPGAPRAIRAGVTFSLR